MNVRIGAAPISWGICEIPGWGPQLHYDRVLDEMQLAGYAGTELGPWGFLPTDPDVLAAALARRSLSLAAAFVPLPLKDPSAYAECEKGVRETAALLQRLGAGDILLADAGDETRRKIAGRPEETRAHGLQPREWPGYAARVERLAQICRFDYGLVPSFHPHAGTFIEHPDEIRTLLERCDPHLVKFCLDTGHVAFGGGDPVAIASAHAPRLGYVHLKDIDLPRLRTLLVAGKDYVAAAQRDVFVELGHGSLDLRALVETLRTAGYTGWIVIEQDRVVQADTDTLGRARRNLAALRALLEAAC
ncbi:MAG: TIM barrel protein [Armatimonadota bacterium]|nr:TIM barrel protein [Armatimonadota bacterium]MDR7533192.1 TIM barrel protein [Armatimonadota bacterium]MDR7535420.1 TIM barrel protein [Armatimonadota bacterium]